MCSRLRRCEWLSWWRGMWLAGALNKLIGSVDRVAGERGSWTVTNSLWILPFGKRPAAKANCTRCREVLGSVRRALKPLARCGTGYCSLLYSTSIRIQCRWSKLQQSWYSTVGSQAIDPLVCQHTHPQTDYFMYNKVIDPLTTRVCLNATILLGLVSCFGVHYVIWIKRNHGQNNISRSQYIITLKVDIKAQSIEVKDSSEMFSVRKIYFLNNIILIKHRALSQKCCSKWDWIMIKISHVDNQNIHTASDGTSYPGLDCRNLSCTRGNWCLIV